jgi:ComF family protein
MIGRARMIPLLRPALDFLFPPRCPGCRETGGSPGFCSACSAQIRPLGSPMCPRCGVPFAGRGIDHLCDGCRRRSPRFDRARACALYDGGSDPGSPLASALHQYKYKPDATLAPLLADLLASRCPYRNDYDVLLPVPLHLERLRWRGFNQAALLARRLARQWTLRLDPFVLVRIRATPPQVGLDEAQRRRNITGAFAVRCADRVRRRKVLLVDDVYTTGATVNECARVLKKAGARRVDVLVLARVL